MTRLEALKAAVEIVDEVAPRTNARGYSDGCLSPAQRLDEVRKTAAFLLSDEEAEA